MSRRVRLPRAFRREVEDKEQYEKLTDLLQDVWGFPRDRFARKGRDRVARAYSEHFAQGFLADDWSRITGEVIEVVKTVKDNLGKPAGVIIAKLIDQKPTWNNEPLNNEVCAAGALAGVVKLWLFIEIKITDSNRTIAELVQHSLPLMHPALDSDMSEDISAKSLQRVAGFHFRWTSDLSQHLEMHGNRISFFRHAGAIGHLQKTAHASLFPAGFLEELTASIRLFFPIEGVKTRKRTRKIEDKDLVDLEIGLLEEKIQRDLKHYRYYGERLKTIQRKYDQSKPHHLKQWWFDRRRRVEWVGLQIAIFSFVVTAIFTIISAVTGILQVMRD